MISGNVPKFSFSELKFEEEPNLEKELNTHELSFEEDPVP